VAVWDTGGGVDPAIREAIFEPYTRGDGNPLVASAAGPGLGLAVARAYARLQGGDLVLEKTGQRGSRFKLTLPMPTGGGGPSQET
jgi:signal transduction histidine kinase